MHGQAAARVVSPGLPLRIDALDAGAATLVRLIIDAKPSVKTLSVTEIGVFRNVKGVPGAFVETQRMVP